MAQPAVSAQRVKAHGAAVRSLKDQGLTWVTFDPIPDLACDIDFGIRQLGELGLLSGTVQGVRHMHAHRDSGDGNNDFSFHLNVSGQSTVVSRRGEATLRDGDAMLLSYSAGRAISRAELVDHRVIKLPRVSLAPLVPNIDDAVLRPIPHGTGMLNLLRSYADAMFDDPAVAAPHVRQMVVAQLCDLIAVTLGATRDAAEMAEGRGIRVARLRAIKDDIESHLTEADLTPVVVARRQRISDSYIRKLFDGEGTSFSEFVLARRLVRANRMLSDQRWADRTIASIAFDCGFGDLSYFNRTFKRLYGARPSDIRGRD